jgi:hypothetical protein
MALGCKELGHGQERFSLSRLVGWQDDKDAVLR